jgi:hypothetical protein
MGATGGRGTDQYNMGQRDPEVHNAKLDLAIDRAMGGAGTQAQQYRALQNASHAHMRSGRGVAGGGFLSDLGIPIVSNLAGMIGLGQTGGAATGGRRRRGGASTGGQSCPMCGMGATGGMMLGQDGHGQRRMGMGQTGGAATGGRRRGRGATGGAMTGGMDSDSDVEGAGFWDDFKSGFNSVIAPVASIAKPLLNLAGPEGMVASTALGALGYGRRRGRGQTGGAATGGAYTGGDARKARGQMVSRLMREKGMSLGEASRYIKENGA